MADNDPLILGQDNSATIRTTLMRPDNPATRTAIRITNRNGSAVVGYCRGSNYNTEGSGDQTTGGTTGDPGETDPGGDGLYGLSDAPRGRGVAGQSSNGTGVHGQSTNGTGVFGESAGGAGVAARSAGAPAVDALSRTGRAVQAHTDGSNEAIYARAAGPDSALTVGVWATADQGVGLIADGGRLAADLQGPVQVGGYLDVVGQVVCRSTLRTGGTTVEGNLRVEGNLIKAGGGFRIDHPLDPENKYLSHSFVESPEMKNLYDGVVHLNEEGAAWIELPEWFEELNRDFRYQLTAIGSPAPEIHVAEEISGNRFKIAGGKKGTKICWQVSGVRKDQWAEANRIRVEEEKDGQEQKLYLPPGLHDQPEELSVSRAVGDEYLR